MNTNSNLVNERNANGSSASSTSSVVYAMDRLSTYSTNGFRNSDETNSSSGNNGQSRNLFANSKNDNLISKSAASTANNSNVPIITDVSSLGSSTSPSTSTMSSLDVNNQLNSPTSSSPSSASSTSSSASSSNENTSTSYTTLTNSILNGTLTPPPDSGLSSLTNDGSLGSYNPFAIKVDNIQQLLDCNGNLIGNGHSQQLQFQPSVDHLQHGQVQIGTYASSLNKQQLGNSNNMLSMGDVGLNHSILGMSATSNLPSNLCELSNSSLLSSSSGSSTLDSSSPNVVQMFNLNATLNGSTANASSLSLSTNSTPISTPKRTRRSNTTSNSTTSGSSTSSSSSNNDHSFQSQKQMSAQQQKDCKYFERRKRNNVAAKKSRDARKQREDEIAIRASFLEKENSILKAQLQTLKDEAQQLRILLAQKKTQQQMASNSASGLIGSGTCTNCTNCSLQQQTNGTNLGVVIGNSTPNTNILNSPTPGQASSSTNSSSTTANTTQQSYNQNLGLQFSTTTGTSYDHNNNNNNHLSYLNHHQHHLHHQTNGLSIHSNHPHSNIHNNNGNGLNHQFHTSIDTSFHTNSPSAAASSYTATLQSPVSHRHQLI